MSMLPSYQDSLMELYNGGHQSDSSNNNNNIIVYGNGSPFLPPPQAQAQQAHPNLNPKDPKNNKNSRLSKSSAPPSSKAAKKRQSPKNINRSNKAVAAPTPASSRKISTSNGTVVKHHKKKKIGSSYHFIPMFGGHNKRRGGSDSDDSDAEDEFGDYVDSHSSSNHNNTNLSDQDVLRDIFTPKNNHGHHLNNKASTSAAATASSKTQQQKAGSNNKNNNFNEKNKMNGHFFPGDEDHRREEKITNKRTGPLHLEENNNGDGRAAERDRPNIAKESFTSALGQRIWRQYQTQHYHQQQKQQKLHSTLKTDHNQPHHQIKPISPSVVLSYRHLPSSDFLKLPSTIIQIRDDATTVTNNKMKWVNIEELERKVLQHHLDLEGLVHQDNGSATSSSSSQGSAARSLSSSILTSQCFTRIIERDSKVGLGMSLREVDGCVYIQALLRSDGSRLKDNYDGIGEESNSTAAAGGPAVRVGLLPGDRLLGLNGQPFLKGRLATARSEHSQSQKGAASEEVLKSVGIVISNAKSPMALHIQRESDRGPILALLRSLRNESKEKNNNNLSSVGKKSPLRQQQTATSKKMSSEPKPPPPVLTKPKGPIIHPFAKALAKRSIIKEGSKEELVVTRQLRIFTDRTRQWESKLSFRLRAGDFTLRPLLDARDVEPSYYASFVTDDAECPPFFDYKFSKSIRSYAPSTPLIQDWRLSSPGGGGGMVMTTPRQISSQMSKEAAIMADLYSGLDENDADVQDLILGRTSSVSNGSGGEGYGGGVAYPSSVMQAMSEPNDIFVPLVGIRKAICVRILNTFLDNKNRVAFTIWCYDVESGMEWYAPVRYYNDFKDLRSALLRVDKTIGDIPFPNLGGWTLGFSNESKESPKTKEARRSQLESFLRRVFAGLYRGPLHPYLAEVAVHLQTFVGCDTVLGEGDDSILSLSKQVAISESSYGKRTPDPKSEPDNNARMHLKRSIQRYVYRLFLLPSVEQLVSQFVTAAMEKVMTKAIGPATRQSPEQYAVDKGQATEDVEKIRDFIDQVQELILEGCHDDLVSLSRRRDFAALVDDKDNSIRDDLFREAVREQTELEVYVPLRSTISKYLVYAWLNEDMEMKHKMKALADKPQSYFRIPKEHRSRSDWKSVSRILREGVGRSTLPCVKLRAVVDAAKEISQLDSEERSVFPDASFFDGKVDVKNKALGADDFLPIFIYCFVQAKIERPSALCELLSVMCDPRKMNGETGYYLASFHAALTHIHELDLTEAENDLSIIFDT